MTGLETCPSCKMSLRLFTPREGMRHINECLDSTCDSDEPAQKLPPPECGVCGRNLTALTAAARQEHANSCADATLSVRVPRTRRATRPRRTGAASRAAKGASGRTLTGAAAPGVGVKAASDPKLRALLDALGLVRYAERFEKEEIDLDALRLLRDEDLTELRVPEAARRRIAEALRSVEVLRRITNGPAMPSPPRTPAQLTQQFPESRLVIAKRSCDAPVLDEDPDDEAFDYLYTPGAASTPSRSPFRRDVRKLDLVGADTSQARDVSVEQDSSPVPGVSPELQRSRSSHEDVDVQPRKGTVVLCDDDDDDDDFEGLYQPDAFPPVAPKLSVHSPPSSQRYTASQSDSPKLSVRSPPPSRHYRKNDERPDRDSSQKNNSSRDAKSPNRLQSASDSKTEQVSSPLHAPLIFDQDYVDIHSPPRYGPSNEIYKEDSITGLDISNTPLSPAPLLHLWKESKQHTCRSLENGTAYDTQNSSVVEVVEQKSNDRNDNLSFTDTRNSTMDGVDNHSSRAICEKSGSSQIQSCAGADTGKFNSIRSSPTDKEVAGKFGRSLPKRPRALQNASTNPILSAENPQKNCCVVCQDCKEPEDSMVPSPETLLELDEWRARVNEIEIQRHKRKMENIEHEYRRLRRKLEQSGFKKQNPDSLTTSGATRMVIAPIDLTLDETPAKALMENNPQNAAPCDIRKQTNATKSTNLSRPTSNSAWRSKIIDDSSSSSSSSSDDDFVSFSDRVVLKLNKGGDRSRAASADAKRLSKAMHKSAVSSPTDKLRNEKDSRNQRGATAAMRIEEPDDNEKYAVTDALSNNDDDDDDEIMDLTQRAPEPCPPQALIDVNSRESVTATQTAPSGSAPPANAAGAADAGAKAKTGAAARTKSRLRKPKKCTHAELRSAIRADPKLLDDILLLRCVEIDRVMASVKSFGLKVSQKGLEHFMHAEGLGFKASAGTGGKGSSQQFFASLATAELAFS